MAFYCFFYQYCTLKIQKHTMKRLELSFKILLTVVFITFAAMNSYSQKIRTEVPDQYKWNLTDIYKTDADWRASKDNLVKNLDEVTKFKGTLTQSAQDLLKCMEYKTIIKKELSKIGRASCRERV